MSEYFLLGPLGLLLAWALWALRNKAGVKRRAPEGQPTTAGDLARRGEEAARKAREEREIADAELKGEVKQAGKDATDAAEFLKESFKL